MSASQDKKKRQAERESGTEKRQVAERKRQEEQSKSRRQWTIGTVIVAVLVAAILLANSNLFYTVLPSVKIGDESYTNAEYQYYYYSGYYQFYNNYSSYASYIGFDSSKSLDEQPVDVAYLQMFGISVPEAMTAEGYKADPTWADYFRELALEGMVQITALYEQAVAQGATLSQEDAASIDEQIAALEETAASYSYSTDKYISAAYGRGCNEKTVRRMMEMNLIASAYGQQAMDGFTYTPEELSAWYAENADAKDTIDYTYYYVEAETVEQTTDVTDETTGETTQQTESVATEETMAAAKTAADAMAARITDAESFAAAVADHAQDAQPTVSKNTAAEYISGVYSTWLLDAARTPGDVTVVEQENGGYYVVLFQNRGKNDYPTVSMRHILLYVTDENEDGEYSEDEIAKTKTAIESVYEQWKSGGATEDSFAELANEYSNDGGSNTAGGLYENVYNGRMVESVNDFLFNPDVKPGDTAIVFNDGSYTGWHLLYFVGTGENYCDYLADQALRGADYTAWVEEAVKDYGAETTFAIKFAQK